MGEHSILPPSGAGAWQYCAMWVTMNDKYSSEETPSSREGAAAHWVVSEKLAAGRDLPLGDIAPNGVPVTAEMIDGAQVMVDAVATRLPGGVDPWHVEQRIAIPRVHRDCFGTPDVWGREGTRLEIADYKFGHGFVDEFENAQGICYAAGLLIDTDETIAITIVQPRCYYRGEPVRTWTLTRAQLLSHVDRLSQAADRAMGTDPIAVTNHECCHCPGRHACSALQLATYRDAETADTSMPVELSPASASLELRMLERAAERLDARIVGLREQVMSSITRGDAVPWHRLEKTKGRRQWSVPPEQVAAIGQMMGVALTKPATVTPAQAIKLGIDAAVIKAYSFTPSGADKLVPADQSDATRVFGFSHGEE